MKKKKKLSKSYQKMSSRCLDLIGVIESLILLSDGTRPCGTLLEIARKKSVKVFKAIEKTRKSLRHK